jgi:2,3-bisphosphoglycerate-dependent phosphoglycerate mutase
LGDNEVRITFMRHGRAQHHDEDKHGGHYDSALTEIGKSQVRARALGWRDSGIRFDCIVASTLQRALTSAKIIGEILGAPVEIDADWMEMNNGPLAGISREVALTRYPKPAFRNPYEPFCGSGESDWELHCRAARAVEQVVRRGAGSYLVVAHGGILNAALRTIVGAPPTVNRQGIWFAFGDAGYARTTYDPTQHQWIIGELKQS